MAKRQKGTMFPRPNRGQVSNRKLGWVSIAAGVFAVSAVIAGTGAVVWYVTKGQIVDRQQAEDVRVGQGLTITGNVDTDNVAIFQPSANNQALQTHITSLAGTTVSQNQDTLTELFNAQTVTLAKGISNSNTKIESLYDTFVNTIFTQTNVPAGTTANPNPAVFNGLTSSPLSAASAGRTALEQLQPSSNALGISTSVAIGTAADPRDLYVTGNILVRSQIVNGDLRVSGSSFLSGDTTIGTITAVPVNTLTLNAELTANGITALLGNTSIGSTANTVLNSNPSLGIYGAATIGTTLDQDIFTVNNLSVFNNTVTVNNLLTVDKGLLRGVPVDWVSYNTPGGIASSLIANRDYLWNPASYLNNNANIGSAVIPANQVKKVTINFRATFGRTNANQESFSGTATISQPVSAPTIVYTTIVSGGQSFIVRIPILVNLGAAGDAGFLGGTTGVVQGLNLGGIRFEPAIITNGDGTATTAAQGIVVNLTSFIATWTIERT